MSNIVTITKDLGTVLCGKEVTEYFELKNVKNVPTKLSVKEENDANGFTIKPQNARVPPGKTVRFKITFASHIPDTVYEKKYTVCDEWDVVAEFCVRCTSLGPEITPNNYKLKFFVFKNVKLSSKRLEIENRSLCPTKFHFERMGNNRPFEVCQESGLLRAQGKFSLDIRFAPSQTGVYHRKIYCLLQYHEPLVFTLVGIYNPRLKVSHGQLSIHPPAEVIIADNYEAYMKNLNEKFEPEKVDSCIEFLSPKKLVRFEEGNENEVDVNVRHTTDDNRPKELSSFSCRKVRPPKTHKVVLTNYFVNMDSNSSFSKGIKLINTSDTKAFFFEWSNDNGKYFSITPKNGSLKESQKLELKLDFAPDLQDRLYHGELDVRIFPLKSEAGVMSAEIITLPVTLNLTAIGHSFNADSAGWLEQCEIEPKELMLPPCAPGHVVYSTLLIKRSGQLPVSFEFFPPEKSCIKVKPPLGYINSSYQIVIVQFKAPLKSDGKYTETWKVGYNHKTTYFGQIQISAKVENPIIIVGGDNSIKFDTVLPGGVSKAVVSVRNPTSLRLHYELYVPEHMNWVEMQTLTGELEPLSIVYMDAIFKPLEAHEYSDYIVCYTKTIKKFEYKASTEIRLQGSCQEGFLVATPSGHDFGVCLYGSEHCKKFHVYNFTPILMHFELYVENEGALYELTDNVIKLIPEKGSVLGKSNIEVEVRITSNVLEFCKHFIKCKLLASEGENAQPFTVVDVRTLFTLEIEGTLPTFQIIDLDVEGGGPLISPDWLWKMMDINKLNEILRGIRAGEEKWTDARLPEALVGSTPLMIHLLMELKGLHPMSVEIKNNHRSHFCNQPSWTTALDAEEFNFMAFSPSKLYLKPGSREVLKLALTFEAVGASIYEWSLFLSQNRVINIRTLIHAFSKEDHSHTSTYLSPDIKLKPIYIGDPKPPVQLYWLYNNTPSPTAYIVDKLSLSDATPPFHKIFDCLNPNGVLRPFSCTPLMFVFKPKELKLYRASTSLCLKSDHAAELHLTGSGTINYSQFTEFYHEETVPEKPIIKLKYVSLQQSSKVFTIQPFSTYSDVTRIFFLTNTSKENVWAFRWHSFKVNNVIMAVVEPVNGQIEPGEKLLLTLTIKSYKCATNINFSIPCDVIDYTSLEIYEKAVKLKEDIHERCKDHFTITEKGLFNEIPEVEIPKKPKSSHIFIAIRANIVDQSSLEFKLSRKEMQILQSGKETINLPCNARIVNEGVRHVINETLEKMLWKILNSSNFEKKLTKYQERYGRVTYPQIVPGSRSKTEEVEKRLRTYLPKYLTEYVMENAIIDILRKNFA